MLCFLFQEPNKWRPGGHFCNEPKKYAKEFTIAKPRFFTQYIDPCHIDNSVLHKYRRKYCRCCLSNQLKPNKKKIEKHCREVSKFLRVTDKSLSFCTG